MCDELVSVVSTTSNHLRSLQLKPVMESTMTNQLLNIETEVLRDKEFISQNNQNLFFDLEDTHAFQAIGNMLRQASFYLDCWPTGLEERFSDNI